MEVLRITLVSREHPRQVVINIAVETVQPNSPPALLDDSSIFLYLSCLTELDIGDAAPLFSLIFWIRFRVRRRRYLRSSAIT